MDEQGLGYLADGIVTATLRRGAIELIRPAQGKREHASIASLHSAVRSNGAPFFFRLLDTNEGGPFPHLKVMTVDGVAANVGNANYTAAALEGRNLELGVLIHGSQVQVIDEFLDLYSE